MMYSTSMKGNLREEDEVRTFPQLEMPIPILKRGTQPNIMGRQKTNTMTQNKKLSSQQKPFGKTDLLPGLLRTTKPPTASFRNMDPLENKRGPIWQTPTRFTALKLDGSSNLNYSGDSRDDHVLNYLETLMPKKLAVINVGGIYLR
jgi:hypothetical protein